MPPKPVESVYSPDLVVTDARELATFCVFYDEVLLPSLATLRTQL